MRLLLAIANFGPERSACLERVIATARTWPFETDIVVHSDCAKSVPAGVALVVGLPTADPFSLPFAHKQLFADHCDDYDLFVYTEDDILIPPRAIETFWELQALLPIPFIPGFFRYEIDGEGRRSYVDAHQPYTWVDESARTIGHHRFAAFSNLHSGCYALTRTQLRHCIASGGYLVAPHSGVYGTRESAATDPYTQCGLTKLLCLSRWNDLLVQHLPNNYIGILGTREDELHRQINALLSRAMQGV